MKFQKSPFANSRIEYILNLISPVSSLRVLNVGISNIPELEMKLENLVKECWTIDIDKKKLDSAQRYVKNTTLVHGDITKYVLPKNYFDVIVVLEVFEHLNDDIHTLNTLRESLKTGGKIIASVPNRHPFHIINPVMYTQHKRHYSDFMFRQLFETNGFEIIHFNVVESWRLLANLYLHIFSKFALRKQTHFLFFNQHYDSTYRQLNRRGLDLIISAKKSKVRI